LAAVPRIWVTAGLFEARSNKRLTHVEHDDPQCDKTRWVMDDPHNLDLTQDTPKTRVGAVLRVAYAPGLTLRGLGRGPTEPA
jgi:hypothetical protein